MAASVSFFSFSFHVYMCLWDLGGGGREVGREGAFDLCF